MENPMTIEDVMRSAVITKQAPVSRPDYEPTELEMVRAGQDLIAMKYLPYDQKVFIKLAKYFARWTAGKKHGLILSGGVGTGKTYFLKSCFRIRAFVKASKFIEAYKENDGMTSGNFWYDTIGVMESETWGRNIIIDDLGVEPICNYYGTTIELMDEILNQRYLDWQRNRALTLITTNLTPVKLQKRYDARTCDRLMEMCDLVEFHGDSVRGR